MPGEFLDVASEPSPLAGEIGQPTGRSPRPFVGIHFACCGVYARVFPNRQHTAYVGNCPRCLRRVELKIGPGGTDQRMFVAQ